MNIRKSRFIFFVTLCSSLFFMFEFALKRLQETIIGFSIPGTVVKCSIFLLLLIFLFFFLILEKKIEKQNLLFIISGIYIAIDFLYKYIFKIVPLIDLLYSHATIYLVPCIVILVLCFNLKEKYSLIKNEYAFQKVLMAITVPIILFGIAQFVLNDPILMTSGGTDSRINIIIVELRAASHVRSFSIFSSGVVYGIYLIFVNSVTLSAFLKVRIVRGYKRYKTVLIFYLFFTGFAIFTTYTRNVYIGYGLSIIGILFLNKYPKMTFQVYVLAVAGYGLMVYFLLWGVYFMTESASGLLDLTSLGKRISNTINFISKYVLNQKSLTGSLFGEGMIQSNRITSYEFILIDNTFLDLFVYSGYFGVIFYLIMLTGVCRLVYDQHYRKDSILWLAMSGVLFSYSFMSMINIYIALFFVQVLMVIAVKGSSSIIEPSR